MKSDLILYQNGKSDIAPIDNTNPATGTTVIDIANEDSAIGSCDLIENDPISVVLTRKSVIEYFCGQVNRRFFYGYDKQFSHVIFWNDIIVAYEENYKSLWGLSLTGKTLWKIECQYALTYLKALSGREFLVALGLNGTTFQIIIYSKKRGKKPVSDVSYSIEKFWYISQIETDLSRSWLFAIGNKCLFSCRINGSHSRKYSSYALDDFSTFTVGSKYIALRILFSENIVVFDLHYLNQIRKYHSPEPGKNPEQLTFMNDYLLMLINKSLYSVLITGAYHIPEKISFPFEISGFSIIKNKIALVTTQNDVYLGDFINNQIVNILKILSTGSSTPSLSVINNFLIIKAAGMALYIFNTSGLAVFSKTFSIRSNHTRDFVIADKQLVVSFIDHPDIYIINLNTLSYRKLEKCHTKSVRDMYISNGSLYTSSWDNRVGCWKWPEGTFEQAYSSTFIKSDAHTSCVCVVNNKIFSGAYWDIENQDSVFVYDLAGNVLKRFYFKVSASLAMIVKPSLDNKYVYFGGGSKEILKIDTESLNCEKKWNVEKQIRCILPLKNGVIAAGNENGQLLFLNENNDSEIQYFELGTQHFISCILEHENQLFCCDCEGTVFIFSITLRRITGKIVNPISKKYCWKIAISENKILWINCGSNILGFDLTNNQFVFSILFTDNEPVFYQTGTGSHHPYYYCGNPALIRELVSIKRIKNQEILEFSDLNSKDCNDLILRYLKLPIMKQYLNSASQINAFSDFLKLKQYDPKQPKMLK